MNMVSSLSLVRDETTCPICGKDKCGVVPGVDHLNAYPFLPGGRDKVEGVEGEDYVIAPYAVEDTDLGRNVYGAGDRVPMADAIKYGLVVKAQRARKPKEDRARKPKADR